MEEARLVHARLGRPEDAHDQDHDGGLQEAGHPGDEARHPGELAGLGEPGGSGSKLAITTRRGESLPVQGRLFSVPWHDGTALLIVLTRAEAEERLQAAEDLLRAGSERARTNEAALAASDERLRAAELALRASETSARELESELAASTT